VGQQFDHGPAVLAGGRHGLGPGVMLGHPGAVRPDELPQLVVAADLTRPRVVHHHMARPRGFQFVRVAVGQGGEVLPDRIGLAGGTGLAARKFHRADEVRKPGHAHILARGPAQRKTRRAGPG
jgi:hypothetical protein